MSAIDLPVRAARKARRDGLRDLASAARYEVWRRTAPPLDRYVYDQFDIRARGALREDAVLTRPTETECLPYKGAAGVPTSSPQTYYDPGERFVSVVEDARIIGRKGLPVADGEIIADCVAPPIILPRRPRLAIRAAVRDNGIRKPYRLATGRDEPSERLDVAAHVLPPFLNYYHWLIGNFAKLRLLGEYGREIGTYPAIVVPADRPSWMEETLELVDYPGRIIPWGQRSAAVDQLVVPTFPDPVAEECRWVRDVLREAADATGGNSRRIFVSRQDAGIRRVTNLEAVEAALKPLGFETVVPGEHSVAEQVRLFSEAEMIVGPHGAGLTNLIFATDATVIELWANKFSATFARLCEVCGHAYERVACDDRHGDLVVDAERLTEVLQNHD